MEQRLKIICDEMREKKESLRNLEGVTIVFIELECTICKNVGIFVGTNFLSDPVIHFEYCPHCEQIVIQESLCTKIM